jgi:hypothetical protein
MKLDLFDSNLWHDVCCGSAGDVFGEGLCGSAGSVFGGRVWGLAWGFEFVGCRENGGEERRLIYFGRDKGLVYRTMVKA